MNPVSRLRTVLSGRPSTTVLAGLECAMLLVAVVLGLALRPASANAAVPAHVQQCDLHQRGTALVTFDLSNDDDVEHNYQVHLIVSRGGPNLGAGTSLLNHIAAGTTVTTQMVVPLSGDATGATCNLWAEAWNGQTGHNH